MTIKTNVLIIGSGVGGLGSAAWCKERGLNFCVVDAAKELPKNLHNGVHYLHSIPELPFDSNIKKITLTDGVLLKNGEIVHQPSLTHSLEYSEKVREIQHPSSILDIGKDSSVYMPENNSLNSLITQMYEFAIPLNFYFGWRLVSVDIIKKTSRFFSTTENREDLYVEFDSIISTAPLNKVGEIFGLSNLPELKANPVYTTNYKVERIVPNWMINLYVPDIESPIYRASILNGICSVESIRPLTDIEMLGIVPKLLKMFHLVGGFPEEAHWETGKVMSISIDDRAKIVDELKKRDVYSVGRFGLHNRKLLVDTTINQSHSIVDYLWSCTGWEGCKQLLIK